MSTRDSMACDRSPIPSQFRPGTGKTWLVALVSAALLGCGAAPAQQRPPMPDPLANVSGDELYESGMLLVHSDPQRAEQYLVASIEKGKAREIVVPMLARICVGLGRYSAALAYVAPVLADQPENWSLRRLAATLHHGLGSLEEARVQYLRVLVAAPDDPVTHYFLGMLYWEDLDDKPRASELLGRYVELAPEGEHAPEVREMLGHRQALIEIPRVERIDTPEGTVPTPNPGSSDAPNSPAPPNVPPEGHL